MRERVNVIYGKQPILLVAPHGPDDTNTALIAEMTAANAQAYAVINQGFDRGEDVDVNKDIADCNRVDHCMSEVVCDEFLKPILKIKDKITKKFNGGMSVTGWPDEESDKRLLIVYIHGAGDIIHQEANEPVDVVVGYGLGNNKDSITCKAWKKNLFVDLWRNHSNEGEVYEGSGAGRYAGRSSNNMNQYFRKHELNRQVDSIQLEFPFSMRKTESRATITAMMLGLVLKDMMKYDSYDKEPRTKLI
jgi:hypothetical protein